ncbi:hypothetical protein ACIPLR_27205 [Herbaspirillum huttiense]|jgi:hypothetical protein|uniref:hypothetical protein n=2 Tax=Oxalobacteraceae TaxID=75682 RepID=UPI001F0F0E99|nr:MULTISPECIES: hypothetical protein [Herbaspirillum]
MDMKIKQFSVASCFSTFVLPHLLFINDLETRNKTAMVCCLAWNISLFPDPEERENHISRVWEIGDADTPEQAFPGLEREFKDELRMLVVQKNDLFPWTKINIPSVRLVACDKYDILQVKTGNSDEEEIKVITHPDPLGLPLIIDHLRDVQENTAEQIILLQRATGISTALSDVEKTQLATSYCVQRADMIGYRRILSVWRDAQPGPSVKRVIGHWLGVLEEIDSNAKSVLHLLTSMHH